MSKTLFEEQKVFLRVSCPRNLLQVKESHADSRAMIHPIASHGLLQNGKYFSILKLMILQQNIASVWIFGDPLSWDQRGHEMNIILQYLVGTIPVYVYELNVTKPVCIDHDDIKVLNIIFVSQSFASEDLSCTCPTDYTILLVPDSTTKINLLRKGANNVLSRIVFGTINSTDIDDVKRFEGHSSLVADASALHNLFIPQPLNRSAEFRIGLQLRPPTTMMYFLNHTYGFYGPDPQLAKEIAKMLNITLIVQSTVGIEYPQFASWFNDEDARFLCSVKLLTIRKRIVPPKAIYDFYRNCSHDNVDMCISGEPLRTTDSNRTTFLYPHYKECLRIVVPHLKSEKQFAEKLGNDGTVQSICLAIGLMFITKIILNRSCQASNWSHTLNVIFAELFGQKRPKASKKFWEKVWNVQLVLLAIFSTSFLSAISYQTLVSVKYVKQIDTLDDLIKSDLKIFVEESRSGDFDKWGGNLDPRLRSKFVYQKEMINLVRKPNYAAFIWDDGMTWLHIRVSQYFAKMHGSIEMRLAKEPLYCGFTSYRVLSGSVFKHSINTLNERLLTSGIRKEHFDWSMQYLKVVNRKTVNEVSDSKMQPLTLNRIYGILVLLNGGLAVGCIIFMLEILWKKFRPLQRRQALRCVNGKGKRQVKCKRYSQQERINVNNKLIA